MRIVDFFYTISHKFFFTYSVSYRTGMPVVFGFKKMQNATGMPVRYGKVFAGQPYILEYIFVRKNLFEMHILVKVRKCFLEGGKV